MKIRSLILATLMLSSCSGAAGVAPVSPSPVVGSSSSPALLADSPIAVMRMDDADDLGSPQELSFDADMSSELDAVVEDVDSSIESSDVLPAETSPAGATPARPVLVSSVAKGTTGTVTWKNGTGGGAPTTYVVLHKGATKVIGLKTTFSFTDTPGRYMIVVYGRNAAGNGLPLTTEVTIGDGGAGIFAGTFLGVGTITRTVGPLTCRWTITHKGTGSLVLAWATSGLVGQLTIKGTHTTPKGTPIRGNVNCLAEVTSYTDRKPVIISGTNIARTGLVMGHSIGTYSGNLVGKNVTGTLKVVYKNGPGTLTMPLALKR